MSILVNLRTQTRWDDPHSISAFDESIKRELLFLSLQLARLCVCVHKGNDIVADISLLSALVV